MFRNISDRYGDDYTGTAIEMLDAYIEANPDAVFEARAEGIYELVEGAGALIMVNVDNPEEGEWIKIAERT